MATKTPKARASKPVKAPEPKKIKIDSQAGQYAVHTRREVELLLNHPDGYPVEVTLHPRKPEFAPLRVADMLRELNTEDASFGNVVDAIRCLLPEEELEMLLDNAVMSDIEQVFPVLFGSDPN